MGTIVSVNFRGDELYGFENDDGVFVALKPIVEAMGLDWSAQYRRVKRDPVLSEGIAIMATPFSRGGDQECVCLKLDRVNGWLFKIDTSRIKDDDVQDRVLVYQRECSDVLYRHFYKGDRKPTIELSDDTEAHEPETSKIRMITEARQTFGAKASGQLWFQLGLPIVPAMLEQKRQLDLLDYSHIKTADEAKAA